MKEEVRLKALALEDMLLSFSDVFAKFDKGVLSIGSSDIKVPFPVAKVSVHSGTFDVYVVNHHKMVEGLMLYNYLPLECALAALSADYGDSHAFECAAFYAKTTMHQVSDELVVLNETTKRSILEGECFKAVINNFAHNVIVSRYTDRTMIARIDYYGAEFKFDANTGLLRGKAKGGLYKMKRL